MFDWILKASLKPRQSLERLTTGSPSSPLDMAIDGCMLARLSRAADSCGSRHSMQRSNSFCLFPLCGRRAYHLLIEEISTIVPGSFFFTASSPVE
jgi:hypothetical protein